MRLASLLVLTSVALVSPNAIAQCCGFDRFPPEEPKSVVAKGFQKAYIYNANGVQRIVLQPSYTGVAKDFGVFLAVPEIPLIEKADEKLFDELHRLTTPPPQAVARAKSMEAASADAEGSWGGVSVIQQQLVGIYEATVLQASGKDAFTKWLKKNGYTWPKNLEPVFQHYVDEGWFFVAMKVNRDANREARFDGPIQPISVRYTSDEIVMPMKLTSLTPGGVDFIYYLVTDTQIKAKNIKEEFRQFQKPLKETTYRHGGAPNLISTMARDTLLTRQDDLDKTLASAGVGNTSRGIVRQQLQDRLWLTKYQGHFNAEDLGDDFVWVPTGTRKDATDSFGEPLMSSAQEKVKKAYRTGMRKVKRVRMIADVFDTNQGYGKPTFINGIYIGDLAAIGGEGSDRWQSIEMELPHSVANWLQNTVTIKVENYGKEVAGKGRFSDAYNIKNVRILVDYDNGTTWESKKHAGSICSVPKWGNCEGRRVKKWGAPVRIRF